MLRVDQNAFSVKADSVRDKSSNQLNRFPVKDELMRVKLLSQSNQSQSDLNHCLRQIKAESLSLLNQCQITFLISSIVFFVKSNLIRFELCSQSNQS